MYAFGQMREVTMKSIRATPDSPYLRRWMAERGQQADAIADAIGMARAQFYRRLRGEKAFHLAEAHAICVFLAVPYSVLFPDHSGIDPRDIEALQYASLVGVA